MTIDEKLERMVLALEKIAGALASPALNDAPAFAPYDDHDAIAIAQEAKEVKPEPEPVKKPAAKKSASKKPEPAPVEEEVKPVVQIKDIITRAQTLSGKLGSDVVMPLIMTGNRKKISDWAEEDRPQLMKLLDDVEANQAALA